MSDGSKKGPKIEVVKDGPYFVSGGVPLVEERVVLGPEGEPCAWDRGPAYPAGESSCLCRCGASENKPFCDGSHAETGFDGTETAGHGAYLDGAERTAGPALDLTWSEEFCVAARFCHAGKDAWNYAEGSDDPDSRARAVQEAGDCPSGALVAWDKTSGRAIEPDLAPEIAVIEDPSAGLSGPLGVKGGIPVVSADGVEYERRNRVTLCRCGRSANKPFCDAAHIAAGFRAKP